MRHDELLELIANSQADDWNVIHCDTAASPSFLDRYAAPLSGDEASTEDAHGMRAAYKPDLSIGLAWGLAQRGEPYEEDWTSRFPDKRAYARWLDVFYDGMLVHRQLYVVVDGGRAGIPQPHAVVKGDRVEEWWLGEPELSIFRLVNAFEATYDFDQYVSRAEINIRL